jgi:serine/threonine-protein kinase
VYQVVRRLGAGGMGTVYDVEDTTIGKRYVLKALHPQLGDREDLARRMQNEARVLARLHHPNIVEVITAGVTGDDLRLPYYVMERLTGHSLRIVLEKKGHLDLPHALHIAIDLLDALEHAHEMGVIHRDVKPDNILLHSTSAGITVTKLVDFGIVSLLSAGPRETAGRFLGTLRYAAPEQLRGEDPTRHMDIYSAALVLYELVSGRGPFDDRKDSTLVAHDHLHRVAPSISRFTPVPAELDALIAAALAKLPAGRPNDAFSFATSLRNIKRALSPERADSTGNRATAASVDPPSGAAPFVEVRRSAPRGSYVLSPAPAPPPAPLPPPTSLESLPRTTVRGMAVPTLGPPPAPAQDLVITAHAAEPVDRQAPTHSLALAQPMAGQAGTEILVPPVAPGGTMRVYPLPMVDDVAPIRWPPEQPLAPSEGPQVRTLAAGSAPATSRAALVMTLSAVLGLAAVAGVLFLVRREGGHRTQPVEPPPVTVAATAPPPGPAPVVAIPTPTLAPPALEDPTPVASLTPPGASTVSSAAASQSARPLPKPRSAATARPAGLPPAVAPNLGDRPGPGF